MLGLVPIGKFCFSHEDALRQKTLVEELLQNQAIPYISVDPVVSDGIVRSDTDARAVIDYLQSLPSGRQPDGLFMPHCNFGTETAVGAIGRAMGLPVLLWGPRDGQPLQDGSRLRDSLCGILASSKVLQNNRVAFTYIENCDPHEPVFLQMLDRFLQVLNAVKRFRSGMRIGLVGGRLPFFQCTMINEAELLERFGITVVPVNLLRVIDATMRNEKSNQRAYNTEVQSLAETLDLSEMTTEGMCRVLAFRDALIDVSREDALDALTVENIIELTQHMKVHLVFALAELTDRGIPAVIESDVHGAISSLVLQAINRGRSASFFMDLTVRHPQHEQGVLLWHNSAPLSLRDTEYYAGQPDAADGFADRPRRVPSIGKHWTMPGISPGVCNWKLKEGSVTVARFERSESGYMLLGFDAQSIDGPFNRNNYLWIDTQNWRALERRIVEGPYLHHVSCIYGRNAATLEELCKYIPGLQFDRY